MRPPIFGRIFGVAAALTALAACPPSEPLDSECQITADCSGGRLCVSNACVLDPSLPIGEEGEGEGVEGEGEGVEGEGEGVEGEGEGDTGVEGEGEGDTGVEGEGEGDVGVEGEGEEGEGEGEGEPPPQCAPACGPLQSCTADDVCTNENGADICDTFGVATIDFFADQALTVGAADGERFVFDGKDRFYVDRLTSFRENMLVQVRIIGNLDTVGYVLDDFTQDCATLAPGAIDQSFTNEIFRIRAGPDPVDIVVTTFDAINAGVDSGAFELETRGILCEDGNAANDVTDTQATYDECFRSFELTTNTCANNPCARDVNGDINGQICQLQANIHTAGTPIGRQPDTPNGPCCLNHPDCIAGNASCPAHCQ